MTSTYLDSSAIVKLIVEESESAALRHYLRRRVHLVASALARTEVLRTVLSEGDEVVSRARVVLKRIELIRINDKVLEIASTLMPPGLRSLDAIHLATASVLGTDLARLVSYDARMLEAAKLLRIKTAAPGSR